MPEWDGLGKALIVTGVFLALIGLLMLLGEKAQAPTDR